MNSAGLDSSTPSRTQPVCVLLFSGKRKSGKDFVTDLLLERIGPGRAVIIKISAPIKNHWAKEKGLDVQQLMSADEYKEKYRQDMILWSESVRAQDPGVFCRQAVSMYEASKTPIWIVSDVRRKTDVVWFKGEYGDAVKTVRVCAEEHVRKERGYVFTPGVDDIASECDLDGYSEWDWQINNNGTPEELEDALQLIIGTVNKKME